MAIDFSIDGISVQVSGTGVGVSIDDLAGLGIDLDLTLPGGGADTGPEDGLDSILGQSEPASGPDEGPATAGSDTFDSETEDTLTLLGGADDTDNGGTDPLTGA